MPGQRGRLRSHPFHQIPIGHDPINKMINYRMAWPVEKRCQVGARNRHANPIGKPLPQGAGSGLNAGRHAVFGMSRSAAAPLPEILQLAQRQIKTGQVE